MQSNRPSSAGRTASSASNVSERAHVGPITVVDVSLAGHRQSIQLRSYRCAFHQIRVPIVLYFHGGMFIEGNLDDADDAAMTIARQTPAWVVSVGYSLAPAFPFPAALEDGYLALAWAVANAGVFKADARHIGVAGHDAGGNLATCLAAMARDRGDFKISAQALLAPLLDPSMTRMAKPELVVGGERVIRACAQCYRAYLPQHAMQLHPYAAPLESRRLAGLPPALIASAENDLLHLEAEKYATALISAGVPTQATRHARASHQALACHPQALKDVVGFFRKWLSDEHVLMPG